MEEFECPHFLIKWIWGISGFWRVCHQIQGNLTHDGCTGVCGEQFVDVLHHSGVDVHQLHVSTTQTTPGRSEMISAMHHYCFESWRSKNHHRQHVNAAGGSGISETLFFLDFLWSQLHLTTRGAAFVKCHELQILIWPENLLSHEAFGCGVKGCQFHSVWKRVAHLK